MIIKRKADLDEIEQAAADMCQHDDIAETIPTEQEPCDDAVSREAVLEAVSEGCQEWRGIYGR